MFLEKDTIAAISTPLGEGGIGIVRLSGPDAYQIAGRLFCPSKSDPDRFPEPRKLYHGIIKDNSETVIDEVLVTFMPAPFTYTREDVVEINCHSGIYTLRAILKLVLNNGARIAGPGEFTKRAFINGRIDLSQAEAVMNIIKARSEEAMKAAAKAMQGELTQKIEEIRSDINVVRAPLEASIDYPEEFSAEEEPLRQDALKMAIRQILSRLEKLILGISRNRAYQEGVAVAIIGRPNVGKSSLLNALLRQKRAIVHEIPGTTRDLLEGYLNLGGYPIKLIDTAGIQGSDDPVEREGIERTRRAAQEAKMILMVFDGSTSLSDQDLEIAGMSNDSQALVAVINKSDLKQKILAVDLEKILPGIEIIYTSAIREEGILQLEEAVSRQLDLLFNTNTENNYMFSVRHEEVLSEAIDFMKNALDVVNNQPIELVSLELQNAWEKMGEITGDTVNEDLLDKVFSEFCLGK